MKTTINKSIHIHTRRLLGLGLAAAALLFSNSIKASVLWDGDASHGTGVFGSLNIENQSGQVNVVTDSTYGKVFQFICFNPTTAIKTRTEGSHMAGFNPTAGNTYYFGWRHKWGPLPVQCNKWQALEQIHVQGGNSSGAPVPYQLLSDGCDNNLHFTYQDASASPHVFFQTPIPLNSWHTFVYHEKWSESASDGYVELWYDGSMKTLANGSTHYPAAWCYPTTTSYWKWGVYRSGTGTTALGTEYAYLGQAKAGTTFADVDPNGGSQQQVAAPTFSPAAGTYSSAQSVTISTTTSGASIRYTTDGSTPTSSSGTVYSGPVTISSTTTLKAIAYESGMTDSTVTSGTYTINIAAVAAPTFSPGGGTYSSAQSVTISSSTSGASIRYTTDGSTPTSSSGTVYSGPVTISSTATLKAIAYKSGMTDSSVTSATYTISSGGGAIMFEAENLAVSNSGVGTSLQTDVNSSGGTWVQLNATGTGNWMEFTLPNVPAGTYTLAMKYKGNTGRGQLTLKVDGTQLGGTLDEYSATQVYPTQTFATVTFSSTGNHAVRLTVTGKNASSTAYSLSADDFTLTPTTGGGGTTVSFEAESAPVTNSGVGTSLQTDSNSSGGTWVQLNATGTGNWMEFTTPTITAGTYSVSMMWKGNTGRGIASFQVDGTAVGSNLDQYSATQVYPTSTITTVTFTSAGTHKIRLTVAGKNASSTAYSLSADKFTFTAQ